ncbi:hypothetical protein [Ensifer sp. LCM 4579]|uniref:hypothetical protein n=1 Tax=Ensifer sp. LCM 4579 TaxID=1848292 RepID=UPI0008DA15C5|nr:hypothetical protein [Ensifer sp. LCM 4579]OHV73320.1 hypothetical protein LCM4579_10360 [Ensifer sp. LCM 4579]
MIFSNTERQRTRAFDDVEAAVDGACEELQMTRDELIRLIIREWLEQYGFLLTHSMDEGRGTEDSALR